MISLRHLLALTYASALSLGAPAHAQNVARFLPRFEAPSHTAREWMARFDHSNGTAVEYLWCLHWLTSRAREPLAPEIVSWLGAWFAHAERKVQAEIEALLVEHGHACPPAPDYPEFDVQHFGIPRLYGHSPRAGADETFVRALASADLFERCDAAQMLVHRQRHVPEALRALFEIAPKRLEPSLMAERLPYGDRTLEECAAFAGTAFVDAAVEELARLPNDAASVDRRRQVLLLATNAHLTTVHYRRLIAEHAAFAETHGQRAIDALRWLRTLEDPPLDRLAERRTRRPRTTDPGLDTAIELCALRGLRDPPDGGSVVASSVWAVSEALAGSEPAYPSVVARLMQLLDEPRGVGDQALTALCEFAPTDPGVIRRCVQRIDALDGDQERSFEHVLVPRIANAETSAALDRLASRACDLTGAVACLVRNGDFDVTKSALARRVHATCEDGTPFSLSWRDWNALVHAQTDWTLRLHAYDRTVVRLSKALVNARTHRARGESTSGDEHTLLAQLESPFTDQDFYGGGGPEDPFETVLWAAPMCGLVTPALRDRVFELALDRGVWGTNTPPLLGFLGRLELTPRERALLLHVEYDDSLCIYDGDGSVRTYGALLARQGHDAIEHAALLRAHAHGRGDLEYLDDLLAISEPAERDLQLVATVLENGSAAQRWHATRLVARRALDNEMLRTRIRTARDDCDTFVAQAARELCATRGW